METSRESSSHGMGLCAEQREIVEPKKMQIRWGHRGKSLLLQSTAYLVAKPMRLRQPSQFASLTGHDFPDGKPTFGRRNRKHQTRTFFHCYIAVPHLLATDPN